MKKIERYVFPEEEAEVLRDLYNSTTEKEIAFDHSASAFAQSKMHFWEQLRKRVPEKFKTAGLDFNPEKGLVYILSPKEETDA